MPAARDPLVSTFTGLAWGLAPWLPDGGALVFAAAIGWAALAPGRAGWVGWAALLGTALHLAWLVDAWRDRFGATPWLAWVALTALHASLPWGAVVASRRVGSRPAGLALAFGAGAALSGLLPLPIHAGVLLADDTAIWLWPAALGGGTAIAGAVAGWGGLAVERPRAAAGVLAAWAATGLVLPAIAPDPGDSLRVGVIQLDLDARTASTPSAAPVIAERVLSLLDRVRDADLVVAPEGAWPYDPGAEPGARRAAFERALGDRGPLLIGANVGAERPRKNSAVAVDGALRGRVDKVLLVPVWERSLLGYGVDRYAPGDGSALVELAGRRIGVLICYEDLFGARVRAAGAGDLLALLSNDAWNGPGAGSRGHLAAARLAAVSAGTWTIRSTWNGRSAVFDRWGRTAWEAPWRASGEGVAATVSVRAARGRHPGVGAQPWLAALAGLWLARRRR